MTEAFEAACEELGDIDQPEVAREVIGASRDRSYVVDVPSGRLRGGGILASITAWA